MKPQLALNSAGVALLMVSLATACQTNNHRVVPRPARYQAAPIAKDTTTTMKTTLPTTRASLPTTETIPTTKKTLTTTESITEVKSTEEVISVEEIIDIDEVTEDFTFEEVTQEPLMPLDNENDEGSGSWDEGSGSEDEGSGSEDEGTGSGDVFLKIATSSKNLNTSIQNLNSTTPDDQNTPSPESATTSWEYVETTSWDNLDSTTTDNLKYLDNVESTTLKDLFTTFRDGLTLTSSSDKNLNLPLQEGETAVDLETLILYAKRRRNIAWAAYNYTCNASVPEFRQSEEETCDQISEKILLGTIRSQQPLNFPEITDLNILESSTQKEKMEHLWKKHAELYHLGLSATRLQRQLACNEFNSQNYKDQTCSIARICVSPNISPSDSLMCETLFNLASLNLKSEAMLGEHKRQYFRYPQPTSDTDILAPTELTSRDTAMYTLGSLYTIFRESEVHISIYENL